MRSFLTKYSARFKRKKMKPTLSISILVSRKRESLEKCLQSLQPFFDELHTELVVVDTGAPPEALNENPLLISPDKAIAAVPQRNAGYMAAPVR